MRDLQARAKAARASVYEPEEEVEAPEVETEEVSAMPPILDDEAYSQIAALGGSKKKKKEPDEEEAVE